MRILVEVDAYPLPPLPGLAEAPEPQEITIWWADVCASAKDLDEARPAPWSA